MSRILILFALVGGAPVVIADTLRLGSAAGEPASQVLLPVALQKSNQVVAVQFELHYPDAQLDMLPVDVDAPGTDHLASSAGVAAGLTRVVVYSPSNAELPAALSIHIPLDLSAESPSGGPSLELRNIIFTNAAGGQIPSAAAYTLAEAWRRTHFSESERALASLVGDDRDPDGDGLLNLLELAAGTDPRRAETGRMPWPAEQPGAQPGRHLLSLTFRRGTSPTAQNAVSVTPETSPDLALWTTIGITTAPTGAQDTSSVELKASIESAGEEARFLRLRIKRIE